MAVTYAWRIDTNLYSYIVNPNCLDDNGALVTTGETDYKGYLSTEPLDEDSLSKIRQFCQNKWSIEKDLGRDSGTVFKIYESFFEEMLEKIHTYNPDDYDISPYKYVDLASAEEYFYVDETYTVLSGITKSIDDLNFKTLKYIVADDDIKKAIEDDDDEKAIYYANKNSASAIYLVPKEIYQSGETLSAENKCIEYVTAFKGYSAGTTNVAIYQWEMLGSQYIAIDNYYNKQETDEIIEELYFEVRSGDTRIYENMKALDDKYSAKTNEIHTEMTNRYNELSGTMYMNFEEKEREITGVSKDLQDKYAELSGTMVINFEEKEREITAVSKDLQDKYAELSGTMVINFEEKEREIGDVKDDVENKYNDLHDFITELSADTYADIRFTESSITADVASKHLLAMTRIEQTATEIRSEAANFSAQTMSMFKQTADNIRTSVENLSSSTISYIDETADRIDLTVAQFSGASVSKFASIDVRADKIEETVADLSGGTMAQLTITNDKIETDVKNLSANTISQIKQTASEITTTIANFSAETISQFKQTADNIRTSVENLSSSTISYIDETADRIDLTVAEFSGSSVSKFASIDVRADKIENTVADLSGGTVAQLTITNDKIETDVKNLSANTVSQIKQTASEITTTIANFSAETISQFKQTSDNIRTSVENLSSSTISYIDETADRIDLTVAEFSGSSVSKFASIDVRADKIEDTVADLSGGTMAQLTITNDKIETDVKNLSASTISRIDQTADTIRTNVANFSAATISEFKQTSDNIRTSVENLSSSTISYIDETADDISLVVTNFSGASVSKFTALNVRVDGVTSYVDNVSAETKSLFQQTESDITTQVNNLSAGTVSRINQKADEVSIAVYGQSSAYTNSQFAIIDTKVNNLTLAVNSGTTRAAIIAKINETGSSEVVIEADNIRISGNTGITGKLSALEGNIGKVNLKNGGITAETGSIGGIVITNSDIHSTNNKFKVDSAGTLYATNAVVSGVVSATTGYFGQLYVKNGGVYSNNDSSYFDADGNLHANNGTFKGSISADSGYFTGKITATSGSIGGINIGNNCISASSGNFIVTSDGMLTATAGHIGGLTLTDNSIASSTGNFYITSGGTLVAKNANIQGSLTLGDGNSIKMTDSSGNASLLITGDDISGDNFGEKYITVSPYNFSSASTVYSSDDTYGFKDVTFFTFTIANANDTVTIPEIKMSLAYQGGVGGSAIGYAIAIYNPSNTDTIYEFSYEYLSSSVSTSAVFPKFQQTAGWEIGTYTCKISVYYQNLPVGTGYQISYSLSDDIRYVPATPSDSLSTKIGGNGIQAYLGNGYVFQAIKNSSSDYSIKMIGKNSSSNECGIQITPSGGLQYKNNGGSWASIESAAGPTYTAGNNISLTNNKISVTGITSYSYGYAPAKAVSSTDTSALNSDKVDGYHIVVGSTGTTSNTIYIVY